MQSEVSYGQAIRDAHAYMLKRDPKFFILGQGVWAPWYVGNSMRDLDKEFGVDRIIDTPVSEAACTGAAIGASLCGYKALVVHPRVDFMILAIDQIVTQAANWSHMFGGIVSPAVTFRGIINRGGEQGAQHSQALQSWFSHIPGLRVVLPATPRDARDLLIASIQDPGPVLYIDDRWLYEDSESMEEPCDIELDLIRPAIRHTGNDITIVSSGYGVKLALEATKILSSRNIEAEVIDLRVVNPINPELIIQSVQKTRRLCAVDVAWRPCGIASEVIALVSESTTTDLLISSPLRITLPNSPAPTSKPLERVFYFDAENIARNILEMFE